METSAANQIFNNLIALFLAEAVRSRRTSLSRAAEISNRVLARLPQMKSESQVLSELTEIEKDFGEVAALKQALHFGYQASDIKVYEAEIRDYASKIFASDMKRSANFLQDASRPDMSIQQLCLKYPDFCEYLNHSSEKSGLLEFMKPNFFGHQV